MSYRSAAFPVHVVSASLHDASWSPHSLEIPQHRPSASLRYMQCLVQGPLKTCRPHQAGAHTEGNYDRFIFLFRLSLLQHSRFGIRKSIRPFRCWCGYLSGADCLHMVRLMMPLHPKSPSSLALFKPRLAAYHEYRGKEAIKRV